MGKKEQLTGTVSMRGFGGKPIPKKRFCAYCGEALEPEVYSDAGTPLVCKNSFCPTMEFM